MDQFHLLPIFALFCLVLKESNASVPDSVVAYWKSMLPNTTMPRTLLQDLLQPAANITFSYLEDREVPNEPFKASYFPGYWNEKGNFKQNAIPNTTITFFLYDDLLPDKKMMLIFTKAGNGSNILPRKIAESIPFSSDKLPEILNYFAIKPTSKKAQIMKQTIDECEAPGIRGEDKYCATSLESLVDFVVAKFGKYVEALSNEAEEENKKQEYTILKGVKMMGENNIVCHKERYAYAVFYCHAIDATKAYVVPLVGSDGSKAKAVVVCHTNTSAWNPQHIAFQILKVKPGGPPICHFLNSDTILWVPE